LSRREAVAHLDQARQFLAAAEYSRDENHHDAEASNAVLAGIRAADAIRAARNSAYSKVKKHEDAVPLTRQAGPEGRDAAVLLGRLLAIKSKAQYDSTTITADAARRAVVTAGRIVELAKTVLAG
jgi:hypothetical protein